MIWREGATGRPGLARGSSGREANPTTQVPRGMPLHPGPSEPGARGAGSCAVGVLGGLGVQSWTGVAENGCGWTLTSG